VATHDGDIVNCTTEKKSKEISLPEEDPDTMLIFVGILLTTPES